MTVPGTERVSVSEEPPLGTRTGTGPGTGARSGPATREATPPPGEPAPVPPTVAPTAIAPPARAAGADARPPAADAQPPAAGRHSPAASPAGELAQSVASGVRWAFLDQSVQQVFRIGINLLLTRLASPEDFGLIGLAFLITQAAAFVTDLGMGNALVHLRSITRRHVTTACTITLGVGVVLAAITVATSGAVARFFDEPDLQVVLVVLSLNFPFRGLMSVPRDLLRRELMFRPFVLSNGIAVGVSGLAAVALAVAGGGVWALVVYSLGEAVLGLAIAVVLATRAGVFRLGFGLDRRIGRQMAAFGSSVSGAKLLYYARSNGDNLLVGKVLGAAALGFYNLSYRMMLFPIAKAADVIVQVALPAFAVVQHDLARMRRSYLRATQTILLATLPVSLGVAVLAPLLVPVLFGHRWSPAIAPMQVLGLNGPRLAITRLNGSVFQGIGRPNLQLLDSVLDVAVHLAAFVIGVQFGLTGMAVSLTVAGYLVYPVSQALVVRSLRLPVAELARALLPVVAAAVTMAMAAEGLRRLLAGHGSGLGQLSVTASAAGAVYLGAVALLAPETLHRAATDLLRRQARGRRA